MGLAVEMPTRGRPVVRVVVLQDPHGPADAPVLSDVTKLDAFDLTTTEDEWSRIASHFFQAASGRISTLSPDIVVVRRADVYLRGRLGDGPRLRLVVEGAITAAAAAHVAPNTHLRTGSDCATRYGQDKATMDADGLALVQRNSHAEAAAAALSGLFGNRS